MSSKNGPLFGKTVQVDVRKGTPLADISGAQARIQRTVAERSTAGGTLTLQAAGTLNLAAGASLDVAGGALHYSAGRIKAPSEWAGKRR